jgi:uncharacterized protein
VTPLSEEDRRLLLRVARGALCAHLAHDVPRLETGSSAVHAPRGAFVSLHRRDDGGLRGCVGVVESREPLLHNVARLAVAAARDDRRFEPVRLEELAGLAVQVSALGPMRAVRPEDVEVGRDGLVLSCDGHRGVLLPQVPVEHGWDRETFLDRTCWKAGLPTGSWRRPEAALLAFVAEVFEEQPDMGAGPTFGHE